MPRPLRIEFPGACYHVMFRGNARRPVFREDADKELLVERMAHFAALFRARTLLRQRIDAIAGVL